MSTSRKTSCGRWRRATSTASTPSPASTSSKPATSSRVVAISLRTKGASSTIRTQSISASGDRRLDLLERGVRKLRERGDDVRIELRAALGCYLCAGALKRGLRAVGPVRRHGVEGVHYGEDPCEQRDVLPGEPIGISTSIPAFVMVAHDHRGVAEKRHRADDLVPDDRMAPHERPLFRQQRLTFEQDVVRDRDLADV